MFRDHQLASLIIRAYLEGGPTGPLGPASPANPLAPPLLFLSLSQSPRLLRSSYPVNVKHHPVRITAILKDKRCHPRPTSVGSPSSHAASAPVAGLSRKETYKVALHAPAGRPLTRSLTRGRTRGGVGAYFNQTGHFHSRSCLGEAGNE